MTAPILISSRRRPALSRALCTLGLVLVACGANIIASAQSTGVALNPEGVRNFGRVAPSVFRGGEVTVDGLANLKAMGVRTVVDLRDDPEPEEAEACKQLGLAYHAFPLTGHEKPDPATMQTVLDLMSNTDSPVYVHCSGGKHRAGTACALYRMRVDGWSPERAWAEQQAYGFGPPEEHREIFLSLYAGTPVEKRLGGAALVATSAMAYPAVSRAKSAQEASGEALTWTARFVEPRVAIRRARSAGATGDVIRVDIERDSKTAKALWKVLFSSGIEYRFEAATGEARGSKTKDADSVVVLTPLGFTPRYADFRRVALATAKAGGGSVVELELKRVAGRRGAFYEAALADGTTFYVDAKSGRQILEF